MARAAVDSRRRGFTLIGVLLLVAILGIAAAATVKAGAVLQRRAAEEDLLAVGLEYRRAFKSYYESAQSAQRYPNSLAELLKDPRFPEVRRHLRKIYADPLTGNAEWGLLPAPGGGIMGVYSLSAETPIKVALFPLEIAGFEGKTKYSEWLFAYAPVTAPPVQGQVNSAGGPAGGDSPFSSPSLFSASPQTSRP